MGFFICYTNVQLIQWLVRGFSKNANMVTLKLSELGNSAFVMNAQVMGTVVPGRLSNLVCLSIAGQMILWSSIGSVKDLISITREELKQS